MASLVVLIVALAAERRALQDVLQNARRSQLGACPAVRGRLAGRDILLVQTGIGADRAQAAVASVAREADLTAVWSLGFAGGLSERLRPGDLVYPATVLDEADGDGAPMSVDASHAAVCAQLHHATLPTDPGRLITVASVLRTPDAKRALGRRYQAVAAEMEAAGVVRAARARGIRWAVLKAIVDAADDPLPGFLAGCTTPGGDLRWGGIAAGILSGRNAWRTLAQLGRASRQAATALRKGLPVAFEAWAALTAL
jgi:adenosylhomocysteine nucleosidase